MIHHLHSGCKHKGDVNTLEGGKGTGKRGHIVADTLLPTQMFPRLPARSTFVADTNFVSGTQKTCPKRMFPSLRSPRNIMGNNVSVTMCPRLPGPIVCNLHMQIADKKLKALLRVYLCQRNASLNYCVFIFVEILALIDNDSCFLFEAVLDRTNSHYNHSVRTTNYLPNCRLVFFFATSVNRNRRKDRTLKKTAFVYTSTTLSASSEPKRKVL